MAEEAKGSAINAQICDYLTDVERRMLLSNLHRTLVWVGVKEPEECSVDKGMMKDEMLKFGLTEKDLPPEFHPEKGTIDVHHLIWRLINEDEITDKERLQIEELVDLLGKKEKQEEDIIAHGNLTRQQAIMLYNQTAACLRALLDLKDILKKREHEFKDKTAKEKAKEVRNFANRYLESGINA